MTSFYAEAFGDTPKRAEIITIIAIGCLGAVLLILGAPALFSEVALWRAALAVLLIFDIVSGCVANFTRSTNDYYRQRPNGRLLFFAVHIHLIALGLLLGVGLAGMVAVWAYTIAAALLVDRMAGRASQAVAAGGQVALGLIWIPLWSGLPPALVIAGLLFLVKLVLAFAVDHFPIAGRVEDDP